MPNVVAVSRVMLTTPPNGFLDDRGGLTGPDERRRVCVPAVDVRLDVLHEGCDRVEGFLANGLARQDAEPGFHYVAAAVIRR